MIAMGGRDDGRVLAVLLFAIAISIDGFAAGVAEGLRGIKVPLGSLLVMNVVSAVVVFLSLGSGQVVAGFLAPVAGRLIGGGVLIALGAWMLWRGPAATAPAGARRASGRVTWEHVVPGDDAGTPCRPRARWTRGTRGWRPGDGGGDRAAARRGVYSALSWPRRFVGFLAMVPGLLDEPARADLDSSGVLTPGEAFLLGLALAIDALGVGFGAGMAGLSGVLTPVVAGTTQFVFVSTGLAVGHRIRRSTFAPSIERVPGGILILLGLMRLR